MPPTHPDAASAATTRHGPPYGRGGASSLNPFQGPPCFWIDGEPFRPADIAPAMPTEAEVNRMVARAAMRRRVAAVLAGAVLAAAFVAAAILLVPGTAGAHDFWINDRAYTSPAGEHCCGESDCFEIPASAVRVTPQGYVIAPRRALTRDTGIDVSGDPEAELVPFAEAPPSEDRKFWRCRKPSGERRCFFASTGGS